MFLAGAQNIEAKKDYINEFKCTPVHGDTGTNMSMTIMSAAKEVTALNKPDYERFLQRRFLQDLCVVQEVTPGLSFHSF